MGLDWDLKCIIYLIQVKELLDFLSIGDAEMQNRIYSQITDKTIQRAHFITRKKAVQDINGLHNRNIF